jgi:hypothetical protein
MFRMPEQQQVGDWNERSPLATAATSRERKLLTTRTPNRSASTAGSPSCQETSGGSCQMVWPCIAMNPRSEARTLDSASSVSTASALQRLSWV